MAVTIRGQPEWEQVFASTFDDHHPYESTPTKAYVRGQPKYFPHLARARQAEPGQRSIVVCVPCYNEEVLGLENTLNSLCFLRLPAGYQLDIIILMDGVKPIADCTANFLAEKFGVNWDDFDRQKFDKDLVQLECKRSIVLAAYADAKCR